MANPVKKIGAIIVVLMGLTGCQMWGTLANGIHKTWVILADERTIADDVSDIRISLEAKDELARTDAKLAIDVTVTVFEGEVLLTGAVPSVEAVQNALTAVWQVAGVRKVYNYIRIAEALPMDEVAAEATVAMKIRTELGLTAGVAASNYKLILENQTVYLMGVKSSDEEYQTALTVIKNSVGVDKIVCLMRDTWDN